MLKETTHQKQPLHLWFMADRVAEDGTRYFATLPMPYTTDEYIAFLENLVDLAAARGLDAAKWNLFVGLPPEVWKKDA